MKKSHIPEFHGAATEYAYSRIKEYRQRCKEEGRTVPQFGTLDSLYGAYYEGYLHGRIVQQFVRKREKINEKIT